MDYVISPWLIYVIKTIPVLFQVLCGLILAGFGIAWIVIIAFAISDCIDLTCEDETSTKLFRWLSKRIVIPVIAILVIVVMPTKETIIQMIVAHNLTYTNINKAIETGTALKDTIKQDIIDIINGTTEPKE